MNIRQEQYKKVPFHTKMNLKNVSEETLEFIVVKAPAPNC